LPHAPSSAELDALVALYNAARYAELEDRASALVDRHPYSGFGWKLLSSALQKQGKHALSALQKTAEMMPEDADAHYNLGVAQNSSGLFTEAAESYRRAIKARPDDAGAYYNLAIIHKQLGQTELAATNYRRVVEIKPDFAEAHNNLGNILRDLGQFDEAEASYRRALQIKPQYAEAYYNLGKVLRDLGRLDESVASFRRTLELRPDFADAQSALLFTLNYTAQPPAYCLEEARNYGRMVSLKVTERYASWQCPEPPQRLRVGIVTGDLFSHPVAYFLEGLLAHIDPTRIELIAYPTQHKEDELTARIRPHFSAWKPLFDLDDEAAARLIHADGVHVLIDLAGHTGHNRLPVFAWKPAPVQVTWLGLPATTGVAEMDYVLGDPYAIPAGFENHFSETVWRMPESYLCLTVPASPVKVGPPPALSAGYVTFGSFNNLTKMTDAVVAVWARILLSVPNSRLLLKTKQLSEPAVCEKTRQRFAAHGISPERLLLSRNTISRDDHLATYNQVDIALDTFPYPGVTTSAEALWMGAPVLSLRGDRFMSCTAGSIAHNAGLPGWIAADEDDYVAKAVAFASDLGYLADLRAKLRQQVLSSPLFDATHFAHNFENALWGMWQSFQARQEKPS
jgi:protein O-GlcNAc transferase